ncbi:MAG: DegV family protein [Lachnospiraceae bacterium]|nr:DegV family protein [Lachnospiraceae bacterium]
MSKIAIMTDSNSGITQDEAKKLGVFVQPMPFYINEKLYYEDISLTQKQFYEALEDKDAVISTSMPALGDIQDSWDKLLSEYDKVVFIPMSSGLSGTCMATMALAEDMYEDRVYVVNNQRISVTLRQSVIDAKEMADKGWEADKIKEYLEETKFDSSIYITVDTLEYLKKGGRITPAAAAIGTILKIKPVLQIHGEKLDAYAKAKGYRRAKEIMLAAIERDIRERFCMDDRRSDLWIAVAYSGNEEEGAQWKEEVQAAYPQNEVVMNPLSLSVACHIGPGALAVTCTKKLDI